MMIISKTPMRVSFFGGGTDYPAWFNSNKGATLSCTIDKYCYLFCRYLPPFFEHKHRLVYSKIDLVDKIEDFSHPSVRNVLAFLEEKNGVEIQHFGDLPARSGMGSSSAFTVGLLNAMNYLQGRFSTKYQLAHDAIYVEQELIKETVGCQDQIAASFGGMNRIDFLKGKEFHVRPILINSKRLKMLEDRLLLFFTGIQRNAFEIAEKQVENIHKKNEELSTLYQYVQEGEDILINNKRKLDDFGRLLHDSWMLKRQFAEGVTTPFIDHIYEKAIDGGAIGGKLLGAGGGGFILFYVDPSKKESLIKSLQHLLRIPFKFEFLGSHISQSMRPTL